MFHRIVRRLSASRAWVGYAGVALLCTYYLNARASLVPTWGQWYMPGPPFILLQVRSFLSGHLAVLPNTLGAEHDYSWGRGGLHQAWGLGVPVLALPFHLVGRLFGAPGFPDNARFLILYAATAVLLARALHGSARLSPERLAASAASAGFVMVFPGYIGLLSSRFWIFEHVIATGALWNVALLSGVLLLVEKCTPRRLVGLCAAAGFAMVIRPPLGVYGATTLVVALLVARRQGLTFRAIAAGLLAFLVVTSLYFVGNTLRFGAPLNTGYETGLSGYWVNRMNRWNLPFSKAPIFAAAKELFAVLFLLDPVSAQTMDPPASVKPYMLPLERWREFYSPTFDLVVFGLWLATLVIVGVLVVRRRLWRKDRDLGRETVAIIGAWSLGSSLALFAFYSRVPNLVTRYMMDLYPAFAAAGLCAGGALVEAIGATAPSLVPSARLTLAAVFALWLGSRQQGGVLHAAMPVERKDVVAQVAGLDAYAKARVPEVPAHVACAGPRGPSPVHTHFEDWRGDCGFNSGAVFAFPYSRCISFALRPSGASWGPDDAEALADFRATADFDKLVSCGPPVVDGEIRRITMCEPHPPPFLLQGTRLYSIATLDSKLYPKDRLRLMSIDVASSCP